LQNLSRPSDTVEEGLLTSLIEENNRFVDVHLIIILLLMADLNLEAFEELIKVSTLPVTLPEGAIQQERH